jgi:hypothetical protein
MGARFLELEWPQIRMDEGTLGAFARWLCFPCCEWEQANGGWRLNRGGSMKGGRDCDGDGMPNRADKHPNNSMRREPIIAARGYESATLTLR